MKIAFATSGCRVNHFDTSAMIDSLGDAGQVVGFDDRADVYVVNTCTVTHKGDADARKLIRRAHRTNPDAQIVVTGCLAQTQPETVSRMDGVSHVLGNSHKDRLRDVIGSTGGTSAKPLIQVKELGFTDRIPELPVLSDYAGRSRATVKIQDGCDYSCTFCVITIARGLSSSVPVEKVIHQIHSFEEAGFSEVVLSGVQMGRYGRDLEPPISLAAALQLILDKTGIPRIRLSSIDPREVTDEFIRLVGDSTRICPHLHIPLQSGDDAILMLMRRDYDTSDYRAMINRLRSARNNLLIGSDIIVGFPGEGPSEFDMTMRMVEELIDHVHVFSYSDRPGVTAASLPDKVDPQIIQRRSRAVRELGDQKRRQFASRLGGTVQDVVVEGQTVAGCSTGYTGHFVPVEFSGHKSKRGELVQLRLEWTGDRLIGGMS